MFVFVASCSCGSEVSFGRTRPRFPVGEVGFGNACCFRFGREAKRNGGWVAGAVGLVGAFAKETTRVDRFVRERTPLGVLGLVGEDAFSVANRRPSGLRANRPDQHIVISFGRSRPRFPVRVVV